MKPFFRFAFTGLAFLLLLALFQYATAKGIIFLNLSGPVLPSICIVGVIWYPTALAAGCLAFHPIFYCRAYAAASTVILWHIGTYLFHGDAPIPHLTTITGLCLFVLIPTVIAIVCGHWADRHARNAS